MAEEHEAAVAGVVTPATATKGTGDDDNKSPHDGLRLLHSTPSTAGLSSRADPPTTGGSGADSIETEEAVGASEFDEEGLVNSELLALKPRASRSESMRARLAARPLSAPSVPSSDTLALEDDADAGQQPQQQQQRQGPPQRPPTLHTTHTPRTFETAVSAASIRSGRLLSARSNSSSLHSSGYGWYEEEDGGGGLHVGSVGRGLGGGHEAHLQVLERMETMRVDLETTAHTAMSDPGHSSTRRLASTASVIADEAADEAADEERARVVAQASSAQQHQREEQGEGQRAAAGGEKQVLFMLAQKDFGVTTKQFTRDHCGPMLLELTALGGGGGGSDEGEEVAFASGAGVGVTPTHAAQQAGEGKGKKANKPKGPSATPQAFFLALGVGGFRIVQTGCGNQHAEYNVILCLNAATYVVWRRYSQFATLMEAARAAHGDSSLPQTWEAWAALERRRKWRRCLSVPYLAGKCAGLEAFLQALVAESLSPALLLRFVASDGPAGGGKR